jgi:hypothetical protein
MKVYFLAFTLLFFCSIGYAQHSDETEPENAWVYKGKPDIIGKNSLMTRTDLERKNTSSLLSVLVGILTGSSLLQFPFDSH